MKLFKKTEKEINKYQKAFDELLMVLGKERVLSAIEDRICYSFDATKQKALPDIVVRPGSTTDVSNTLRIANKYEVPIYARGAGSGLTGGAVPLMGGIVFDLKNMDKIIEIRPDDFTATVEPGVVTKQLQDEVAKFDLFYPPDPSSAAFSTIGGNVAECAGGITGLKYGVTRDYILALEIVLPDGSVIKTGGRKLRGVVGYDLTRLFTGSEGTLGIFTKITVKLIPKPEKIRTLAAYFRDRDDAIDAADQIIDNNILPRTLEFLDYMTINAVRSYSGTDIDEDVKALLLVDIDGTDESISYEMPIIENACKGSGAFKTKISETGKERDAIWADRRSISPALYNIAPHKINEDICVPRSKIKEALQRIDRINDQQTIYIANFGHIGDGNIHVNIMYNNDPGQEELAERIVNRVMKEVVALGGSISGEHGIGNKKSQFMEFEIPPREYDIMKRFKNYFDPKGIMNPGKMFIR
ncbi:dehydrogenase [Candidatus Scalindua japonica]|uniref:Dehydrogenase n=1 Tax=Candidatus Scalindua japonica TaxID=1284222 RepID=A0A286U3V5_9BACT|nr:FAD-linked oxidase C-terminal domain-containing protein [Candidatus Scalindua japonica]GAX62840.1 dehydrogenase [Candidatus Scalindua japonica]